jgi:hypothetical protein
MSFYALTKKGEEDFTPPVFEAGTAEDEEAVGVFTTAEKAQAFLEAIEWQETDEIAELEPLDLLAWLLQAYQEGLEYLIVDPDANLAEGEEQTVLALEDEFEQLAETLAGDVRAAG